ncbi:MAG: hypothetical protein E6I87_07120 [Chloroflexi bacterium]|nr:MAG: hypothetical protein E6I87_07120 [Chloroflexota bacterium]
MSASGPSASVIERAGLVLSGMGVLSLFTVRSYIENVPSTAPDITYGVAAFLALTILATLRRAPSWAPLVALIAVSFGYLYANAILDGTELGTVLLVVTLVLGYRIAPKEWRALVVGGLSLWTPALTLYSGARPLRVEPPVAAAAVVALGLFVFVLFRYRSENEDRLRRVGPGLVAIAVTSAVFERHNVVSSSILAPDDIAAILAVAVLAVVGLLPRIPRRAGSLAAVLALSVYALVCLANILGKSYNNDAVVAPHWGAELLLRGEDPYVAFDMREGLQHFGLQPNIATRREDGSLQTTLNYPAGAILVVAPFVALGLDDIRWIYFAEMLVFGALMTVRAREIWRPFVASLFVADTLLRRQYVLAGIDPTWSLGVAFAWLLSRRRILSPLILGLGCATRQLAWFFVPFYLLAAWREYGRDEAIRRAPLIGLGFLVPNLPFIAWDAGAWWRGMMGPILDPLAGYGVGLVHFELEGVLPDLPRGLYAVLAVATLLFLLTMLWRRWRDLPNGALAFPLIPLFFAWRSLSNYFVFVPLFAILRDPELMEETPEEIVVTTRGAIELTRRAQPT